MTLPRTLLLVCGMLCLVPRAARAEAPAERTHVVYTGQRLGSIAKRYGVTVEAICSANDLRRTDILKPGQRLVIPAHGERDASRAHSMTAHDDKRRRSATQSSEFVLRTHRVEAGQRLESIARRYNVPVEALRTANRIGPKALIRPGQILKIPDRDGNLPSEPRADRSSPRSYIRRPVHRGVIELVGYNERYRGRPIDRKGKLGAAAFAAVSRVLAATGDRPKLDPRLIRLLVEVSDTFGGRPIRVVSGYRTTSYYQDSRHKMSRAVDFSIPGVPNSVIRDYLRTLTNVGVGYYPNSSFVHMDVRDYPAYWVDYAGPGEAPRHHNHEAPDGVHEEEPGDVLVQASTNGNVPGAADDTHPGTLPERDANAPIPDFLLQAISSP